MEKSLHSLPCRRKGQIVEACDLRETSSVRLCSTVRLLFDDAVENVFRLRMLGRNHITIMQCRFGVFFMLADTRSFYASRYEEE